jgi:transposase
VIITAVVVEGRSQAEVARDYGVSPGWVSKLVARYRTEGDAAFEPRSRRPHNHPAATPAATVDLIVGLRRELAVLGLDAGADTIVWHLEHHHQVVVSRATIYRVLRRQGLIEPAPKKKPKSSYIRFQAEQPNETWQADFTHHRLIDGTDIEILTWLDDHSRFALSVTAHRPVTGPIVVNTFRNCTTTHGVSFSTLTDNGLVFTTRFSNRGKTSRNGLENELAKLGVRQKNSRPNHPTTCGKVERFQQTMKNGSAPNPAPRSPSCKPRSTRSSTTTTITARTDHSFTGPHQQPRTWRDPKPVPSSQTATTASSESATTASTADASACA